MDEETIAHILDAKTPKDVFGSIDQANPQMQLKHLYRFLFRAVHPDRNKHPQATDASAKLADMYDLAKEQLVRGTYNKPPSLATIITSSHSYEIYDPIFLHRVVTGHRCIVDDKANGIFSIAKSPRDNDLVENEAKVITALRSNPAGRGFFPMLPNIYETVAYREGSTIRKANIYHLDGEWCTLAQALKAYPYGVNPRDMAWIYRRVLELLGYVHREGYLHGGIVPDSILIGLGTNHRIKLINWYGAVSRKDGQKIQLLLGDESYYPSEIKSKEKPCPASDIYMLAACMNKFVDHTGNRAISAFLQSCLLSKPESRPHDAYQLRREFTTLIDKLWKREYRPFTLPTNYKPKD